MRPLRPLGKPARNHSAHMNPFPFGLLRVTAAAPEVFVADPARNLEAILAVVHAAADSDVVLLPELCISGYTAADLFSQTPLLDASLRGLVDIARETRTHRGLIVVGLPLQVGGALYNSAAAIHGGRILGLVPKRYLPTYREFYEGRWFRGADGNEPASVGIGGEAVPFGIDLLFRCAPAVIGIEICEDLWTPIPPSSLQTLAGANVLLNPSASNEIVGKARWRTDLVVSQSGRCLAAYAYAGAGPTESTTDVVFGGHCLIAENGVVLEQSRRIGDGMLPWRGANAITADVDLERLDHDRRVQTSFDGAVGHLSLKYRMIDFQIRPHAAAETRPPKRFIPAHPFVPPAGPQLDARCAEVFAIQTAGLAKRVSRLPDQAPLVIGISGGLDSTLALLSAAKACDSYGWPRKRILGVTMPGFGTSEHTRSSALDLMRGLGIGSETIDIRPLCLQAFRSLRHRPLGIDLNEMSVEQFQQALGDTPADAGDLVFENVQARIRTFLLMSRGFVLGTGDLSEQALGWSTYNGDHMSMYNVNTSVPKTLVRFLVRYAADRYFEDPVRSTLHRIADTPISPELLPLSSEGEIRQDTEAQLGPYELHDFFLFHVVRNGFGRDKILYLARHAEFAVGYDEEMVAATLETFYRRFFANQFKRSCVPDGPKVGTVSLSPRGDWRMPSDADRGAF